MAEWQLAAAAADGHTAARWQELTSRGTLKSASFPRLPIVYVGRCCSKKGPACTCWSGGKGFVSRIALLVSRRHAQPGV